MSVNPVHGCIYGSGSRARPWRTGAAKKENDDSSVCMLKQAGNWPFVMSLLGTASSLSILQTQLRRDVTLEITVLNLCFERVFCFPSLPFSCRV